MQLRSIATIFSLVMVTGCASITKDSYQRINVETYNEKNEVVEDVYCVALNNKGQWKAKMPDTILAHRSSDNLKLKCKKEGEQDGVATLRSRVNGNMFGNIIFGGGIGAIMDHASGKAYDYPEWVRIIMGKHFMFDRKDRKEKEVQLGKEATVEELEKMKAEQAKEKEVAMKAAEDVKKK